MTTFSLHTEIHTGDDAFDVLARFRDMRVLIVTDAFLATTEMFRDVTARLGSTVTVFDQVEPNPTIHLVGKGTACYLAAEPEVVIALGGGSPIDAAKAMHKAALTVGKGAREGLVAIPTTSGSGSEVTSYAVITDEETHAKLPMVSPDLRPRMAILDPRAVVGAPPTVTVDSGMDALTHSIEAYVSTGAGDFSDACAEKSAQLVFANLHACYANGSDLFARRRMHNASTLAAIAFDNAGLGIVHSLAHALGGRYPVAHGRLNAMLLTHVMTYNAERSERASRKYAWLAHLVGCSSGSNVKAGVFSLIGAVDKLRASLGIPSRLADAGVSPADLRASLDDLAEIAMADGCTPSNPVVPTREDLVDILRQLL
ncbi:MAG: 1-propanol dehydrogenase PduQ [Tessaracoccus sp.]